MSDVVGALGFISLFFGALAVLDLAVRALAMVRRRAA